MRIGRLCKIAVAVLGLLILSIHFLYTSFSDYIWRPRILVLVVGEITAFIKGLLLS